MNEYHAQVIRLLKGFPHAPGVYLFKDADGQLVYIGKAKDLKKRGAQYIQSLGTDVKTDTIFSFSATVECMTTQSELEALLLEAKLIQSHQPRCNVLLKSGQPFLYIFISSTADLPTLTLVRNQRAKGTYFGPFLEKGSARKVYDFLIKTFRLKMCGKRIENGCLFYHLGQCAGSCRSDFDRQGYLDRLELAKQALRQGHKKFLEQLEKAIAQSNKELAFEKSRELHHYLQAFQKVFYSLEQRPTDIEQIAGKHVWVLSEDQASVWVFAERDGLLKKRRVFYLPPEQPADREMLEEYFLSFYRLYAPPATILTNIDFGDAVGSYEQFCVNWHQLGYRVSISQPTQGHLANVLRLAVVQVQQELLKQRSLAKQLKMLLKLPAEPHTIDCFDISHKQGVAMVGSCVRFVDGQPDKNSFRRFHIRTVSGIDDYASLREIVARRYKETTDLPDLIVIDGGKGQLNAVQDLFAQVPFVCLAKREETIFSNNIPEGRKLDPSSYVGQMLIALRDYAHHFAISFHRSLASPLKE